MIERHADQQLRLVTASAGNHGRALAHAAGVAGLPLRVYVPEKAPRVKQDAIRAMGAELIGCTDYDEAELRAKRDAASGSSMFISPYSHPDVIAGAGTIALEILEQDPQIDAIVVPVGGGGLVSGIAVAVKGGHHGARVVGVEVEASCPFRRGLTAGRIVHIDIGPSLADGLTGNLDPETMTFEIVRQQVDEVAVVSEDQLRKAIRGLFREERLITEGAGATAVAAIASGVLNLNGGRTAVIVSGANIDAALFASLICQPGSTSSIA